VHARTGKAQPFRTAGGRAAKENQKTKGFHASPRSGWSVNLIAPAFSEARYAGFRAPQAVRLTGNGLL